MFDCISQERMTYRGVRKFSNDKCFKASTSTLSPEELEFIAGDSLIQIMPRDRHEALYLGGKMYGPLVPGTIVTVPLWVALMLKRRNKAQISCPQWMDVSNLEQVLRKERKEDEFSSLPFSYIEIASMILSEAYDDLGQEAEKIKSLIEDIEALRRGKIYKGMGEAAQRQDVAIKVKGISAMELRPVRTFFSSALESMYDISGAKYRTEEFRAPAGQATAGRAENRAEDNIAPGNAAPPPKSNRLRRFR